MSASLTKLIVWLIFVWLTAVSCGKPDQTNNASVRILLPTSAKVLNNSLQAYNASGGWSDTDPTTLDEIVCYAIAVEGPEPSLSSHSCTDIAGEVIFNPFVIAGTVIAGAEIQLDVLAGENRSFYAIGFGAVTEEACLNFSLVGHPERDDLSAPHIIGVKTVDLVPGEIDLEIGISMDDAIKFNECTGDLLTPDPAVLQFVNAGTFDFGDRTTGSQVSQSFILDNTGGSAAEQLSEIGLTAPYGFTGGAFPGTGGTCATTLESGSTCTISIAYAPVTSGNPVLDDIEVSYFDGYEGQTVTKSLTAIASSPATLSFTEAPLYDFGSSTVVTLTAEHIFTVTNNGDFDATSMVGSGLVAPYSYKGGGYPGTGGSCGVTLVKATSCTIVVTYTPPITGLTSSTIQIDFNDGTAAQSSTCAVQGTGIPPALLTIDGGPTYNFGTGARGSSNDHTFVVTNTGGTQATTISGAGLANPFSFKGGTYPGTAGTCGVSLANGSTCTIVVNYLSSVNGTQNDTIDLPYFDALANQNSLRAVQGTAIDPALIGISNTGYNFGTLAIGATKDFSFTLSNTGASTASSLAEVNLSAPYTIKGSVWPGTGGDCGTSLLAAANCMIVVTYTPTGVGVDNDTIQVDYNDGAANVNATNNISGTGANPASLAISDGATYNYGNLTVGLFLDKTFTISNGGGVSATVISGVNLVGDFDYVGGSYPGGGTCSTSLTSGGNCTLIIRYTPATAAVDSDSFQIDYTNGVTATNTSRGLAGTGDSPATLTISDGATYNFGNVTVGLTADKAFTISNTGDVTATGVGESGLATDFDYAGGGSYPGGGTCGSTLASSANCTVIVRYSPTAAAGDAGSLQMDYTNGVSATNSARPLSGVGIAPAAISISESDAYSFGNHTIGTTAPTHLFVLTNNGGVGATGLGVTFVTTGQDFTFNGAFPGSGGDCGTTLGASGATCTIDIRFSASSAVVRNDTIRVDYTDGVGAQNSQRTITGTGIAPALLTISDGATYNYGSVTVGLFVDKTFTITNSGGVSSTGTGGAPFGGDYSYAGGSYPGGGTCGTSVAASGGNCTVIVRYTPTTAASDPDTFQINYTNGVATTNATRAITGTGLDPALIVFTDANPYNYGTQGTATTTTFQLTIQNTGDVSATSIGGVGLAAPFVFEGGSFPGTLGDCGTTLTASSTCTISVDFTPPSAIYYSDILVINYNDGVGAQVTNEGVEGTGL